MCRALPLPVIGIISDTRKMLLRQHSEADPKVLGMLCGALVVALPILHGALLAHAQFAASHASVWHYAPRLADTALLALSWHSCVAAGCHGDYVLWP